MAHVADLTFRHLQALTAVADTGTFGRAGQALGFTQSAISQQIASLERIIGAELFDRRGGSRGVELTGAGRLLLRHAHQLLQAAERAGGEIDDLLAGTRDIVRVGTFQSITVSMLPLIIRRLATELPSVQVRITEDADQDDFVTPLADGTVDLNVAVGDVDDPRIDAVRLGDDPFVIVVPTSMAGSVRQIPRQRWPELSSIIVPSPTVTFPLAALVDNPLLGQTEVHQAIIDDRLRRAGIEPNYVFRSADNGAVQAMVRVGIGIAVMPLLAVDVDDPDVIVCWPDRPLAPRTILIAHRRDANLSNATQRFVELAREVCAPLTPGR